MFPLCCAIFVHCFEKQNIWHKVFILGRIVSCHILLTQFMIWQFNFTIFMRVVWLKKKIIRYYDTIWKQLKYVLFTERSHTQYYCLPSCVSWSHSTTIVIWPFFSGELLDFDHFVGVLYQYQFLNATILSLILCMIVWHHM